MPRRQVLADDAYDALKGWILTGRIPPGTRLKIDRLAAELGVSNTPVRQALGRLEADGLVVKEPYRGFTSARPPTAKSVEDLYGLRILIEPHCAGAAASLATTEDRRFLGAQFPPDADAGPGAGDSGDGPDVSGLREADEALHIRIAATTRNLAITETLDRIFAQARLLRAFYRHSDLLAATAAEHRAVVEAVARRDPAGAETAMRAHLVQARARILDAM